MAAARWLPLGLLASACAHTPMAVPVGASVTVIADDALPSDWKAIALPADLTRISLIEASWSAALREAQSRRFGKAVQAEGTLLEAKAALPRPAPPPGRYRCRIVKVGISASGRGIGFARFKPFYCFVQTEGALLTFTKGTGTQRPGGRLWDDGDARMIFLGGSAEGRGAITPYGGDPRRNRAGVLERIGDFQWRLVFPGQASDAHIEVMELVPDTPPPTEAAQ